MVALLAQLFGFSLACRGEIALWTNHYSGPEEAFDLSVGVAADSQGNIFVTGSSRDTNFIFNIVTVKYSAAGTPVWTNIFDGPSNQNDMAARIVVSPSNEVYVAGASQYQGSSQDFVLIKYANDGLPLWTNVYNNAADGDDNPTALAVDTQGDIVVAGRSTSAGGGYEYATLKYQSDGTALWTNTFLETYDGFAIGTDMALDADGNVYVTGSSQNNGTFDANFATIKYSPAGAALWTNYFRGAAAGFDNARAIAVGDDASVYVTGSSEASSGSYEYATVKYSSSGTALWTNFFGASDNDVPSDIDVKGTNVCVTGQSVTDGANIVTVRYSGSGVALWTNNFGGYPNGYDYTASLKMDAQGNTFVTGLSSIVGSTYDIVLLKYSDSGEVQWTNRFAAGFFLSGDRAPSVALSGSDIVVAGWQTRPQLGVDFITVKYGMEPPSPPITFNTSDGSLGFTNGQFSFQLTGAAGQTVVIEASTNSVDWIPVMTNVFGAGPINFSDPESSGLAARFYRARLVP